MTKALGGILAPVTTPFIAGSEGVDLDGFAANLTAHLADGLDGIVVAGSTGEAALLTEEERASLHAIALDIEARLAEDGEAQHSDSLVDGVNLAVERFEVSHPNTAMTLRNIMQTLANMGI